MSCSQRTRRVGQISAVARTSASSAVDICHTTSITSDPENTWIARRQSAITAALAKRRAERFDPDGHDSESLPSTRNDGSTSHAPGAAHSPAAMAYTHPRLSGESERIGEGNWDETSPFGKHVGYL
ncbi:MAG TPA: hypothetical protein VGC14_14025 [Rhizobium sp.]